MNMFKKNGGFTLVELIVVIAILAILAGIAVPAYTGYITRANDAAVITELDAIKTAAQSANATKGEISGISITNAGVVTISGTLDSNFYNNFKLFYSDCTVTTANNVTTLTINNFGTLIENTSYSNGVTWSSANGWVATPAST